MPAIEYRIFGPPGTGKTTTLTNQIQAAGKKHGMDRVFVASFTKAAAHEIAGRNKNAPNVGTLHAHGYRALGGHIQIAENLTKEWNKAQPHYELTGGKNADVDEVSEPSGGGSTVGDELYADMQMYRAQLVPRERWKTSVLAFADRWEAWKAEAGVIDYTDMIELPLRDIARAPGDCVVGFFDEAQDFTPLELALVRRWGEGFDYIVLAGDDDQTIFGWAGARPEVLLEGKPAKKIVLSQSYRVPRAIHALAQRTISGVRHREPKNYKPRNADGEVRVLRGATYQTPEQIVRDIETRYRDKMVMVLASCTYMLAPIIKALRAEGIPFWNPYRVKAGAWNPLARARSADGDHASSVERMLAFIRQVQIMDPKMQPDAQINIADFLKWYEILKVKGNIARGAKDEHIADLSDMRVREGRETFMALLAIAFFEHESGVWDHFGKQDTAPALDWFFANIPAPKARVLEYPRAVFERRGPEALMDRPKIVVGTIHSVKGAEADAVYILPDLSRAGYIEATQSIAAQDAITRLKYVAYTRARESLILCDAATSMAM